MDKVVRGPSWESKQQVRKRIQCTGLPSLVDAVDNMKTGIRTELKRFPCEMAVSF